MTRPSPALTQFGSGTCVQRDRSGGPSRCRSAASRIPGCRGRPLPHPHALGWLFSHVPESTSSPGLDASKVTHTPMFTVRCKFKGLWQMQARVQQCGIRVPRRPCTAHPPLSPPGSSGHRGPEAFQTGFFRSASLSNTHRRLHHVFGRPASPFPCSAERRPLVRTRQLAGPLTSEGRLGSFRFRQLQRELLRVLVCGFCVDTGFPTTAPGSAGVLEPPDAPQENPRSAGRPTSRPSLLLLPVRQLLPLGVAPALGSGTPSV